MDRCRHRPGAPRARVRRPAAAPGRTSAMDPALPDRVLQQIRRLPRTGGRDPAPSRRPRRYRALHTVLLLLLTSLVLARDGLLRPVEAGPLECERALRAARALRDGPWLDHTRALQAIVRDCGRADPSRQRALERWARALHRAGRPHDAAAGWAHAGRTARAGDAARARAALAEARVLHAELDDDAALARLWAVPRRGAHLLAPLLAERGDREGLRALLEADLPDATHLRVLGRLGELALRAGDRAAARRCLRRARRIVDALGRRTDAAARQVLRVWLRLPLREQLAG